MSALKKSSKKLLTSPLEKLGSLCGGPALKEQWAIFQDYALVNRDVFLQRPDLVQTGRTLFGSPVGCNRAQITADSLEGLESARAALEAAALQRGAVGMFHEQPFWPGELFRIAFQPKFGARGAAADVLRYAFSRAANHQSALCEAFGITYNGVFSIPSAKAIPSLSFTIIQAIIAESLELILDEIGDDLNAITSLLKRPLPTSQHSSRYAFNQLLEKRAVHALQLPEEDLEAQVRALYKAHAEAGLSEMAVLLNLFPQETHELGHFYAQLLDLGDEAKVDVLETVIAPKLRQLHQHLTELEEQTDDARWPVPKTHRLFA